MISVLMINNTGYKFPSLMMTKTSNGDDDHSIRFEKDVVQNILVMERVVPKACCGEAVFSLKNHVDCFL